MDLVVRKHIILVLILIGLSLVGCKKDENEIIEQHSLSAFHTLDLNDAFEVELLEQNEFAIEIQGAESFVKAVDFKIQDSVLAISSNKKLKWTSPGDNQIKIIVKGMGLKLVNANESCIITSLNPITTREFGIILKSKANTANIQVDNDVCYYWNNFPCGGKLTLSGRCRELKLWNTAIMSVDASSLLCEYALVENDSKGDCSINVSNRLDYKIAGEGNIILFGNAVAIDQGSSNSGRLIRR